MDLDFSSSEVVRYIHEDCLTVCESAGCCRLQDPPGPCCGMGRVSRWGFVFISSILLSFTRQVVEGQGEGAGAQKSATCGRASGDGGGWSGCWEGKKEFTTQRILDGHHLQWRSTDPNPDGQNSPARITHSKGTRRAGIEAMETSVMARPGLLMVFQRKPTN